MRRLYREHRGNPEPTIRAFADAERRGDVRRSSNAYNIDAMAYARMLLADGLRRGWLKR
jgi:hypothetical protein